MTITDRGKKPEKMAFRASMRKNVNIKRVVSKIALTVLTLYVGGTILTEIGEVMNGTTSPFYEGLTLIGWDVGTGAGCASDGLICSTTGTGILTVVGLVAIASIVMEFVDFKF